jgi:general secretion pathway protein A
VFTKEALDAVYTYSLGVPRSINNLCDTALMLGFAAQSPNVTEDIVKQAARDTGLDVLLGDLASAQDTSHPPSS